MKQGFRVEEWQRMADKDLSFLERAALFLGPFACLTANAIAHLREDWIEWRDNRVRITVPPEAPPNSYHLTGGGTGDLPLLTPRDRPCWHCRNSGTSDRFEHLWQSGLGEAKRTKARYTTVLHRELAAPAVELLEKVFITHDRPEFAATPDGVNKAARRLGGAETADGIDVYPKFLRTGPVLYAEYGLSADYIADLTRYEKSSIEAIVSATPGVNFELVSTLTFLRTVAQMEPVTVEDLGEELDLSNRTINDRLVNLREEERVSAENAVPGRPAAQWRTTERWDSPFSCDACGYETYSLGGFRTHKGQSH
jgi:hypothetical protein